MCIFINKMRPRIELRITWSLEELQKLINDENSCVYMEKCRKHVALHPIHLNDLNKAFHDILGSSINFYDAQFKGLLLAYKNPKLLSQLGTILYDSHFIHVDIEANFYLFRPEKGRVLTGVVNKKADNYIGVLVHKAFNVSIPKVEEEDWEGDNLEAGDDVTFTIVHVDLKGKLPFIRGKLLPSDTSKKTSDKVSKSSHIIFNSDEEVDNETNENVLEPVNKNESKESNHLSVLTTMDSDSSVEELQSVKKVKEDKKSSKSSKKTHKNKDKYEEEHNDVRHNVTANNDDFPSNEGKQSTKSSKKNKKVKNSEEKLSKSKKRLKDDERHVIDDENVKDDYSLFDRTINDSSAEKEVSTSSKTSRKHKRKQFNDDESSPSEPVKKIPKHKQVEAEDIDVHNNVNDERNNIASTEYETETSTPISVNENNIESSEKSSMHKARIKRELSYSPVEEERCLSSDSEAEISRTLSGWVARPTSPEKSPKRKEKIKMEKNQSCTEEENFSSLDSEAEVSKISSGREKRAKSPKKSSKHKEKKIKEQNNLIVEEINCSPVESEAEPSRMLSGREKCSKSPKKSSKHKERIKVEPSEERTYSNDRESSLSHIDTEIEDSENLSQNEDIPKSSKKSSKHKKKIKEERIDPSIDSYNENEQDQTLETSAETTEILKSTKHVKREKEHSKSRKSNLQDMEQAEMAETNVQFNNDSLNNEATISKNEDEMFVKPSKKKKRSSNHEEILSVKIKEEPLSDCESISNRKSKKKRKSRKNADESLLNNENTEISESDNNSDYRKQQDKETKPVINPTTGRISVKQEFVIKEEGSKKKKNKEDSHPNLKIKRESTSSDVEGTAVKKKSRTLFTE